MHERNIVGKRMASFLDTAYEKRRKKWMTTKGSVVTAMEVSLTGVKTLAVCLVFALCTVVGGAVSGLNKIGQPESSSSKNIQQVPPTERSAPRFIEEEPRSPRLLENPAFAFLAFSLCAGGTVSYVILRSSWYRWSLIGAIFVGLYGIATVATQMESAFFLPDKLPRGLIRAVFVEGAIAAALFSPGSSQIQSSRTGANHAPT